jgi:hypothetical protein
MAESFVTHIHNDHENYSIYIDLSQETDKSKIAKFNVFLIFKNFIDSATEHDHHKRSASSFKLNFA